MNFPTEKEHPPFYSNYLKTLPKGDFRIVFEQVSDLIPLFFEKVDEKKSQYRYLPEKWSIREVVSHLIEVERIFAYRALVFSRNDETHLPGFDEDNYVKNGFAHHIQLSELLKELVISRRSTLLMLNNMPNDFLSRMGNANNNQISVNAIFHIIAGHQLHHFNVISERYL
mgnify:FL=1